MRRKSYPFTNLQGGLNVDIDAMFLTDGASPNTNCVRLYKNRIRKDVGFAAFDDDAPARPMKIAEYNTWDGDYLLMLATLDDLYYLNAGTWTQVRPSPGTSESFTGNEDNLMSCCVCQDHFIITNGKDSVYKYDGSTMDELGGLPTTLAVNVVPFYNTLVLCGTIEGGTSIPYRVRWSEVGDFETWSGGATGYIDLLDTPDIIMAPALLGDRLFIFKQKSIWEIYYTDDSTTALFEHKLVNDRVGTLAAQSVISLGEVIVFLGNDGWYAFDGVALQRIGEGIDPLLFDPETYILGYNTVNRSVSIYQENSRECILVVPTAANDEPNLLLKYNLRDGGVSKQTKNVSALGKYVIVDTPITWTAAKALGTAWEYSSWDIAWVKYALPLGSPRVLYASPDGTIEKDDRVSESTDEMLWESKDYVFAQAERWLWFEIWCKGDAFYFSYSKDGGVSWSDEVLYTPASSLSFGRLKCEIGDTSDTIRMRIKTSDQLEFKLPTPWYVERGRQA